MSAAVNEVKTKKEINTDIILAAVNSNKPITIKAYYFNQSTQDSFRFILALILEKYNKSESMEVCFNSVKSLVVNAMKANIKRVLFKRLGLDITNPKEYTIGMEKIGNHLSEKNFYRFKDELIKQNLSVNTTFNYNPDGFSITVKNHFILLPHEYELSLKPEKSDSEKPRYLSIKPDPREAKTSGQTPRNSTKVVSLDQYKIDQQIFSQSSNPETNETIVKLDIVLKDKNTFNTETFSQEMDALHSSYREKFKQVLEGKAEEKEEKSYQTISRNFATSIRGTGDFLNQLNRVQSLDSQFYREQQLLLANYGENVFKTIQDKLHNARIESNAFIGQIQKIGKDVFDLNKNQITEFIENRDVEIEKQTNAQIEKQKKKIEELNANLDSRIENQAVILNGQVNELLDQLNKSTLQLVESAEQEISKLDSIFENKSNILKDQVKKHLNEMGKSSITLIESTKEEIAKLDSIVENKSDILKDQFNKHLDEMNQSSNRLLESTVEEISRLDSIVDNKSDILKYQFNKHLDEMNQSSTKLIESTKEEISKLDSVFENKSSILKDQLNKHLDEMGKSSIILIESTKEEISKLDSIVENKSGSLKDQVSQHLDEMNQSSTKLIESTKEEISKLDSVVENKSGILKDEINQHFAQISKYSTELIETTKEEVSELDSKVKTQSEILRDRVNQLLEEINKSSTQLINSTRQEVSRLDLTIENKSLNLKEQVNEHIEQLTRSSKEFIFTTNQEISKFKEDIKLELDGEINLAELRKNNILMEINTEKESLENSLRSIKEEIRNVEKFRTNKEVMDNFAKLSDEAFWRMSSNIEVIQEKERKINQFMNNINLLETAIRKTEEELKILDVEKADYLTKKGKVVENIDSKIKQMEKFGEEMKEKLIEISGFERKLNIISGSLTEQVKKTRTIDEQLSKFSREVYALESKRKDLNHFVDDVDQKVALINSRSGDIKVMESKYNNIERMMLDLSARHKQITTMESRLEDVKSHIENLLSEAQNKIAQMNLAMQTPKHKRRKGARKRTLPSFREL